MLAIAVSALLAQGAFPSTNLKPLPPSKQDYYFIALGDDRPAGPGLPPTHTFRELLKEVGTICPEFVLSSGDMLYGNEETLSQYKQEVAWMKPLIQTLPCPFFNVAGNHEINNRPEFLQTYTAAFGPLYGSFDFGGIRFLAVCTELPAQSPSVFGAELSWLKRILSTKKPTVVFQHHPVFVRGTNSEKESAGVADHEAIHKLYLHGGVVMVVEGHDHIYNRQVHDGIDYRIAGGAGAPMDGPPEDGGFFHFLLVHVHNGKLESTLVPIDTLEVLPLGDGVAAVSDYAYIDLPLTNVVIESSFAPKSISASYTTKKKKSKGVDARIVSVQRSGNGYRARVALVAPHAHAVTVRLSPGP